MAEGAKQLAEAIREILTLSNAPGEASFNEEEGVLVLEIPTKVPAESREILTFLKNAIDADPTSKSLKGDVALEKYEFLLSEEAEQKIMHRLAAVRTAANPPKVEAKKEKPAPHENRVLEDENAEPGAEPNPEKEKLEPISAALNTLLTKHGMSDKISAKVGSNDNGIPIIDLRVSDGFSEDTHIVTVFNTLQKTLEIEDKNLEKKKFDPEFGFPIRLLIKDNDKLADVVDAAFGVKFEKNLKAIPVVDKAAEDAPAAHPKKAELDAVSDKLNALLSPDKTSTPASVKSGATYTTGVYVFSDAIVDADSFKALEQTLNGVGIDTQDGRAKFDPEEGRRCLLIKDSDDLTLVSNNPDFEGLFRRNLLALQAAKKPDEAKPVGGAAEAEAARVVAHANHVIEANTRDKTARALFNKSQAAMDVASALKQKTQEPKQKAHETKLLADVEFHNAKAENADAGAIALAESTIKTALIAAQASVAAAEAAQKAVLEETNLWTHALGSSSDVVTSITTAKGTLPHGTVDAELDKLSTKAQTRVEHTTEFVRLAKISVENATTFLEEQQENLEKLEAMEQEVVGLRAKAAKKPEPEPVYEGIVLSSSPPPKPALTAAAEAERVANRDKVKLLLEQYRVLAMQANVITNTATTFGDKARTLDGAAVEEKSNAETALGKVNFTDDATVDLAESTIKTALTAAQAAVAAAREAKTAADKEVVEWTECLRLGTEAVSSLTLAHENAVSLGIDDPELERLFVEAKEAQAHAQKLIGPAETRSVNAQKFIEKQEKNLEPLKGMLTTAQGLHAIGEKQRKAELDAKAARDKVAAMGAGATLDDKAAAEAANKVVVEGLLKEAERLRDLAKGLEGTTNGLRSENKTAWESANAAIESAKKALKAAQDAKPAEAKTELDAKEALEKARFAIGQITVAENAVSAARSSTYTLRDALEAEKSAKEKALAAASKTDAQAKSLEVGGDLAAKTEQGLADAVASDREAKAAVEKCEQAIQGDRGSSEAVGLMEEPAFAVRDAALAAVHRLDAASAVALAKAREKVTTAAEALTAAQAGLELAKTKAVESVKRVLRAEGYADTDAAATAAPTVAAARLAMGEIKKAADEVKRRADEVVVATGGVSALTATAKAADPTEDNVALDGAALDAYLAAVRQADDASTEAEADLEHAVLGLIANSEAAFDEEEAAATAGLTASRPTATAPKATVTAPVKPVSSAGLDPDVDEEEVAASPKPKGFLASALGKVTGALGLGSATGRDVPLADGSHADPTALTFADPDASKSSVRSANSKDYSIKEIENFFREAMKAHEDEYEHKLGYDITATKKSFTVSKDGEQLAVVEKNKTDKSISYKFAKDGPLDFGMADVVLRSSQEQVLTLHSSNLEHIEQILKAAATPPNDTKIKIKLDAATDKFLKEELAKGNINGDFTKFRLEADGFAAKETTTAKMVEDAKKVYEAAARANTKAVPALLDAKRALEKAAKDELAAGPGTAKEEAKKVKDEAAETARLAQAEADKVAAELKTAKETLDLATKGASSATTGVSAIKQDTTEAAKAAAEQFKKDVAAKASTSRRLST